MAFDSSIKAFFGGDVSGLKTAIHEAGAELDKFSQRAGARMEHHVLGSLFGMEMLRRVKDYAQEAIKGAQATRDELEKMGKPIDGATASLAAFGDGLADLQKGAVTAVGFLVGGFTQIGDLIGSGINRLRGISEADEKAGEVAARNAEKAAAALAKLQAENSPEKLAAAEARLEKDREARRMAGLTGMAKMQALMTKELDLQKQIAVTGDEMVKKKKLQDEAEKVADEIAAVSLEIQKKAHDQVEKINEKKVETAEKIARLNEEGHQLQIEQMSAEQRVVALTKDEAEAVKTLNGLDKNSVEYAEERNRLLKIQGEILKANAEVVKEEHTDKPPPVVTWPDRAGIAGFRTSAQFGSASERALRAAIDQDRARVQDQNRVGNRRPFGRAFADDIEVARAQMDAYNAQKELDRRQVMKHLRALPEAAARGTFQGDPLAFDRIYEESRRGADYGRETVEKLDKIHKRLGGLFTNQ